MSWKKPLSIIASVLLVFVSGCFPLMGPTGDGGTGQDATAAIDTRVAEIIASTAAAQTAIANAVVSTLTAMATNTPESTFTSSSTLTPTFTLKPSHTYTPSYTFTSSKTPTLKFTRTATLTSTSKVPLVSVSVQTNCRVGPGTAYDVLGIMNVGQTAQVVGRSASSDNWIIKLPSKPAIKCWLWGQYATVVGNTAGLPVINPPPTPTPHPTQPPSFLVDYTGITVCPVVPPKYSFIFKITNNGSITWESNLVTATDQTAGFTYPNLAINYFPHWVPTCSQISTDQNLEVGEVGYTASIRSENYPVGHNIIATIKVCSLDGMAGTCLEKTITFTP